jgi:hypothetical protein
MLCSLRHLSREQLIVWEELCADGELVFLYGKPLIVSRKQPTKSPNEVERQAWGWESLYNWNLQLRFLRGTFNIKELVTWAADAYNQHGADAGRVDRFDLALAKGYRGKSSGDQHVFIRYTGGNTQLSQAYYTIAPLNFQLNDLEMNSRTALPELYYCQRQRDLVSQGLWWLNNYQWYRDHGIAWRASALLVGPPGCGKSKDATLLARQLKLPIVTVPLGRFDDTTFSEMWELLKMNTPCVVLLDDFDRTFDLDRNRTATAGDPGLTFECLLQHLDGTSSIDGIFVVLAVNHPERVDAALAASGKNPRHGRIDQVIHYGNLTETEAVDLVKQALHDDDGNGGSQVRRIVLAQLQTDYAAHKAHTAGSVIYMCTQLSLPTCPSQDDREGVSSWNRPNLPRPPLISRT